MIWYDVIRFDFFFFWLIYLFLFYRLDPIYPCLYQTTSLSYRYHVHGFKTCRKNTSIGPIQKNWIVTVFFLNLWTPRLHFFGGIKGAKCVSEGAKIKKKKNAVNGWFWPFFFFLGGGKWGQSLDGVGANAPSCPPPLMPPLLQQHSVTWSHIFLSRCIVHGYSWKNFEKALDCAKLKHVYRNREC